MAEGRRPDSEGECREARARTQAPVLQEAWLKRGMYRPNTARNAGWPGIFRRRCIIGGQGSGAVLGLDPLGHVLSALVMMVAQHGAGEVVPPLLGQMLAAFLQALDQGRAMYLPPVTGL